MSRGTHALPARPEAPDQLAGIIRRLKVNSYQEFHWRQV